MEATDRDGWRRDSIQGQRTDTDIRKRRRWERRRKWELLGVPAHEAGTAASGGDPELLILYCGGCIGAGCHLRQRAAVQNVLPGDGLWRHDSSRRRHRAQIGGRAAEKWGASRVLLAEAHHGRIHE